jgi:hypothetical protein
MTFEGPYSWAVITAEVPRTRSDHGDDIARLDVAVLHADLEPGGKDVGEQDALGVTDPLGNLVDRVLGERHRTYSAWVPSIM